MSKLDQFESARSRPKTSRAWPEGFAFSGFTFAKNNAVVNQQNFTFQAGFANYVVALNSSVITQS